MRYMTIGVFCLLLQAPCIALEMAEDLPSGGLAVIGGQGADQHARELARNGRWLVYILATDRDSALAMAKATQDLHPLITVGIAEKRLPFASQTVNVIIRGPGSTWAEEEVFRVIAPQGHVLTYSEDKWAKKKQPVDKRHAPWVDYRATPQGTGVSADTAVGPSASLRWFDQSFVGQAVRSQDGVVAHAALVWGVKQLQPKTLRPKYQSIGIHGRDAFSGVPLWHHHNMFYDSYVGRLLFAAHPLGFIHPQRKNRSPAVLTDARTGKIRVTYDQGIQMVAKHGDPINRPGNGVLLVSGGLLVQVYGKEIAVLDVPTGNLVWRTKLDNPSVVATVSTVGNRLFVCETNEATRGWGRWGSFQTVAMAAYDLETGRKLWRNTEWANRENLFRGKKMKKPTELSDLIAAEGRLFVFDHSSNISSDHHADLYEVDVDTGAILWDMQDANFKDPKHFEYRKHGAMTNNMVFWDGKLINKIASYGKDGKSVDRKVPFFHGGNQRCVRVSGAANYLMWGHTGYYDRDGKSYQTFMVRGNCAMPNYATYGAIVSVTDETCGCYNGLRGNAALIPQEEIDLVANDRRLDTSPMALSPVRVGTMPESPIVNSWPPFLSLKLFPDHENLGPVQAGPVQLKVDVQNRIVHGLKGETVAWSYRADGRVHTLPSVYEQTAYVSTTNGTVTALDLATGKPKWTFLAALNRDQVVVNGQIESRWPVHHTVVKDGTLYCLAGRHVELDGGLAIWALDVKDGEIKNHMRLYQPVTVRQPGEQPRNTGLRWRGDRKVASRAIQPDGMALNKDGQVCISSRFFANAARAKLVGMWSNRAKTTGNRADNSLPDFTRPTRQLIPIDIAKWNGKTVHPQSLSE